jgi:hypothetical protein
MLKQLFKRQLLAFGKKFLPTQTLKTDHRLSVLLSAKHMVGKLDRRKINKCATLSLTLTLTLSQTHSLFILSDCLFYLFVCLSHCPYDFCLFYLSLHLSVCLTVPMISVSSISLYIWLSVSLYICLSVCLSLFVCLSVSTFVCLSLHLSVCLYICLSLSMSLSMSLCLSLYLSLSVCLSI